MKKSFKALIAALIVLFAVPAAMAADDFDWSQCWCNYGGGIEKGDLIINIDGGLYFTDLNYLTRDGAWFLPPVMVEVQVAQPIWKLPFTFGGYAGVRGYGYKGADGEKYSFWAAFFGAEAAYHVMFPPKGLDLYAVTRIGGNIPFRHIDELLFWDYFGFMGGLGASWYFNDVFGLNLEFGAPMSKFGVTLKF